MIFSTKPILTCEDILLPHHNNSLIYLFRCCCGLCNLGRTNHRLDTRIKQHLLKKIRRFIGGLTDNRRNTYGSAEHQIDNLNFAENFSVDFFSIRKVLETIIFCPADRFFVNRGNVCQDLISFRYCLQYNIYILSILNISLFFFNSTRYFFRYSSDGRGRNRSTSISPFLLLMF